MGRDRVGEPRTEGTRAQVGKCNNIRCRCEMRVRVGENAKRQHGIRMGVRASENMGCE